MNNVLIPVFVVIVLGMIILSVALVLYTSSVNEFISYLLGWS